MEAAFSPNVFFILRFFKKSGESSAWLYNGGYPMGITGEKVGYKIKVLP